MRGFPPPPVVGEDAGTPRGVVRAPFVLLRVAGMPLEPLHALAPAATSACVAGARDAANAAEGVRAELLTALRAAVPRLDRRPRGDALALSRAVHNRRPRPVDGDALDAVRAALDPGGGAALASWLAATDRLAACEAEVDAVLAREVAEHVRPRLRTLAADEALRRPLALAAPALLARIDEDVRAAPSPRATKVERSLLGYLMRAAAKTSPFSTFMHVALLDSGASAGPPPVLDPAQRTSHTALNRSLVFALRAGAAGCCGDPGHAAYLPSPALTWVHGGVRALAPAFGSFDGRIIRVPRPSTQAVDAAAMTAIAQLPARVTAADLGGITAAGSALTPADLVAAGVIVPAPWADAFTAAPHASERGGLDGCASEAARTLRRALDEMGAEADAIARGGSGERRAALARIRGHAARAAGAVGVRLGDEADAPIVEDACFAAPAGAAGGRIDGLLDEVAAVLSARVEPRPHFVALRELFVGVFGVGGTCYDAIGFLSSAAGTLRRRPNATALATPPEPVGTARPRVPLSVLLQVSDDSGGHPDGLAVLNRVLPGCGHLAARYASGGTPMHEVLRSALRSWLRAVAGPLEAVDLLVSGDCNGLQAHPRLTERALACPLAPTLGGEDLSWRDLTFRHRAASGEIEVLAEGRRIAPVYLGTTSPHAGWGPAYWLTVLAAPWRARSFAPLPPAADPATGLPHAPRATLGRVVVSRATWWMPAARARDVWMRRAGGKRLIDVATDCDRLGLPDRFYVTMRPTGRSLPHKRHRKPFWIDIRNPLLLDVLERAIDGADELRIVEALPDIPSWPVLDGRPHVSEVQAELVL